MESYCLALLGKGLRNENISTEYGRSLYEGFSLVLDTLLRSERRNNYSENDYKDPIIDLLQSKQQLNFAVCCSHPLEDYLNCPDIINNSHWSSVTKNTEQLTFLMESLKTLPVSPKDEEEECSGINDDDNGEQDDDDDNDDIADKIHHLIDLLPSKDDAVVQFYWILPDYKDLTISNTLPLFGTLKRLQENSNASITIIVSSTAASSSDFLSTWKKWLKYSIVGISSNHLHDIPIWHGSLTSVRHQVPTVFQDKSVISLPGFAMSLDKKDEKELYLQSSEDREQTCSRCTSDVVLTPEIHLLNFTPRNSIPLFLFLPFKLKLHLLYDDQRSETFMNELSNSFTKGLCLLACITIRRKSPEKMNSTTNFKSWMDHVTSSFGDLMDGSQEPRDSTHPANRRLCVIDADRQGEVCVYFLRSLDVLDGKFYEYLEHFTTGKQIVQNTKEDNVVYFQDMSDCFPDIQKDMAALHFQNVDNEIEKHKDHGKEPITDKVLYEILMTSMTNHFPHQSSKLHAGQQITLDLSNTSFDYSTQISDLSVPPNLWPEKLWLMHNDPVGLSAKQAKNKVPVCSTEVLSMSAKDILTCFRPDGRPVKDNLSPLRPRVKPLSENHVYINTDEATIRETCYPESLMKRFHGVEYCLDSCSSLSKDVLLSSTQSSVVKQETLSLCTELIPIAFPKKTKSTTQSVDTKSKPKSLGGSTTQPVQRLSRSSKRKSPPTKQTSKQVKRKRIVSPKNEDDESSKTAKESRSQRHKRRLRLVVDKTLDENGINTNHAMHSSCSERLYSLIKSFLKDLKSSHGLNETMKELAYSNVKQVINFEETRLRLQEQPRTTSTKSQTAT